MHQREAELIPDQVVAPDFVHAHLVVFAEPSGHIHHVCRHIEVELDTQPGQRRPLREGLEVVDRLSSFHLDHRMQAPAASARTEQDIRENRPGAHFDGRILFISGVRYGIEPTTGFGLQQPDDTVVLELFADRTHENRAHQRLQQVDELQDQKGCEV